MFCAERSIMHGTRSRVQRFRPARHRSRSGEAGGGSRFRSHPRIAFVMRIYEKSVSFVRPNPRFEAKLAIILENQDFFVESLGSSVPSLSLTLNVEP